MTRGRIGLGALGVLGGVYGAYLLLSRGHDLLNALLFLAGGVVVHDGMLSLLVLGIGAVALRAKHHPAMVPAVVGLIVLGSVTLLSIPVMGRFGERPDNATLLDRNYTVGWLVFAGVVLLVAGGATVLRLRRQSRT